jgi:hypothetical protein
MLSACYLVQYFAYFSVLNLGFWRVYKSQAVKTLWF